MTGKSCYSIAIGGLDQSLVLSIVSDGVCQGGDQAFLVPCIQLDQSLAVLIGDLGGPQLAVVNIEDGSVVDLDPCVQQPQLRIAAVALLTVDQTNFVSLAVAVGVGGQSLLQILLKLCNGVDVFPVHAQLGSPVLVDAAQVAAEEMVITKVTAIPIPAAVSNFLDTPKNGQHPKNFTIT